MTTMTNHNAMKKYLFNVVLTSLWVVPLLICLAISAAYLLAQFKTELNQLLNHELNWPITLGYGVLMLLPMLVAAIRGKGKLTLALLVCLSAYMYSVGISINDPYYWGHVPKLYIIVWAICLALSRWELMTVNFVIVCVAYLMVDRFGDTIGPGVATEWKLAHNALYVLCAAAGAVAAALPNQMPPNDADFTKEKPRECLQVPNNSSPHEKAA